MDIGENTRIILFNNERQDSALIVELTDNIGEKTLLLNLNDSGGYGFEKELLALWPYITVIKVQSFIQAMLCWMLSEVA